MKLLFVGVAVCVATVSGFGASSLMEVAGGNAATATTYGGGMGGGGGGGASCYSVNWGGSGPYCIWNDIYWCSSQSGQASKQQTCNNGCVTAPAGTPDYCRSSGGSNNPDYCYNNGQCGNGQCCFNGKCGSCGNQGGGGGCNNHNQCGYNQCCYGGQCGKCNNSGPSYCNSNSQCSSGQYCCGGVCQNSYCGGGTGGGGSCSGRRDCNSCFNGSGCLWDPYSNQCKSQEQCNFVQQGGVSTYGGGGSSQSQVCLQYRDQCSQRQCGSHYDRYSCENQQGFNCAWRSGQCVSYLDDNRGR